MGVAYLYGELKQRVSLQTACRYLQRAADNATPAYNDAPYLLALLQSDTHPKVTIPRNLFLYDLKDARKRLLQAANLGHAKARCEAGWMHEYGEYDTTPDPVKSFEWYKLAATDNKEPEGMMGLSGWYLTGVEGGAIESDEQLAFACMSQYL
jgi:TPR repeat protein